MDRQMNTRAWERFLVLESLTCSWFLMKRLLMVFKSLHLAFCKVWFTPFCSRKVYAIKKRQQQTIWTNVPVWKACFLKRKKKATDFIIGIIMTGNFGALEQRHGKFLPRSNIDTVSDYRDFQNRAERRKSVWLKVSVVNPPHGWWCPNR